MKSYAADLYENYEYRMKSLGTVRGPTDIIDVCSKSLSLFKSPFSLVQTAINIHLKNFSFFGYTSVEPYFSRNGFLTRVKNSVGFVTRREEFDRIFHSCRTYSSPICDKLVRYQFYI